MRNAAVVLVAAGALAGCGGGDDDGYPKESVDAFVKECDAQPNTARSQCECVIARLQASMPYDEFARADAEIKKLRQPAPASLEKLRAAVQACGSS